MVQRLTKNRTALFLYALLVVLPTVVLGGLHWYQFQLDHVAELEAVPRKADDAARRLVEALHERVQRLIADENRRPFYIYGERYAPEGATDGDLLPIVPSPLSYEEPPEGILGWFDYKISDDQRSRIETFFGSRSDDPGFANVRADFEAAVVEFARRHERSEVLDRLLTLADGFEI